MAIVLHTYQTLAPVYVYPLSYKFILIDLKLAKPKSQHPSHVV